MHQITINNHMPKLASLGWLMVYEGCNW